MSESSAVDNAWAARGMEWSGIDPSGMEWSGIEPSGMEWSGIEWSGAAAEFPGPFDEAPASTAEAGREPSGTVCTESTVGDDASSDAVTEVVWDTTSKFCDATAAGPPLL